jgi:hypothetical protein
MNIFVSNLSQHVMDSELRKLFSAYGEVASARVMREERNGRSRGSAVVSMINSHQRPEPHPAARQANGSKRAQNLCQRTVHLLRMAPSTPSIK